MHERTRRWLVGGGLAATTVAALVAIRHVARPASTSASAYEELPRPNSHACAEGLEPLVDDACYAAPAGDGARPLVIYLHGYFDEGPGEQQTEALDQQRRVAARATSRGYALLALRGTEGACASSPVNANKVCWPSNEKVAYKGPRFVDAWKAPLAAAAARHAFGKRYILGFSNGGFFAGLIAVRALYDADAFVVAHAGPVEPVKALGPKPPLLLMSADDDLSQEGMVRFDDELTREEWPHDHYVRGGGHALPDSDIEVALTFFDRTRTESLPLRPPLSTRTPRAREPHEDAEVFAPNHGGLPLPATDAAAPSPSSPADAAPGDDDAGPL